MQAINNKGINNMSKQYRIIWRKSWHDGERKSIWYKSQYASDRMAESIRNDGFQVMREEVRDIVLAAPVNNVQEG